MLSPSRIAMLASLLLLAARPLAAQPVGTYHWQLQPYCNVLTLTIVQEGTLYRLEGSDDLCGAARVGLATGLAVGNADGTIGFGLTIVDAPTATPVHVSASLTLKTLGGAWRDSLGHAGTLAFVAGPGAAGEPRPARARAAVEWEQASDGPARGVVARAKYNYTHYGSDGAAVFGQWGDDPSVIPLGNAGLRGDSRDQVGVLGVSENQTGVHGFTVNGTGVFGFSLGASVGVRGTSRFGIGVLAQATPDAGSTALQIDGPIRVGTQAPAFRHVATAATITGDATAVEHPQLDGDANALVYVTPFTAGTPAPGVTVRYAASRWWIATADGSPMPAGAEFNVLVVKR